jgi:HK97 family phage major capsid protein
VDNLRAVIDGLLVADVLDKLDQQVIAGTGVSPEMLGVLNTPGIGSVTMTAGETTAETLLRAIALVQQASGLLTDGIAIAPGAWTALLSVKTAPGGTYLSGAPTAATPTPTLWGLPVVPSAALPANTAIVGHGVAPACSTSAGAYGSKPRPSISISSRRTWWRPGLNCGPHSRSCAPRRS